MSGDTTAVQHGAVRLTYMHGDDEALLSVTGKDHVLDADALLTLGNAMLDAADFARLAEVKS